MALLDPKTYQGGLTSVPGKSLSETNTPEQIQAAQQPQQQQPVSTPPSTLPNQPPSGMFGVNAPAGSQYQFANVLQTAIDRQKALDPLIKQRQLLIKHLYDTPLSSAEISQLSPEIQQAIQTGNKPDIEMQLRLLSDGISNRSGTLDQSIQFLTQQYQQSQQDLEQQRQQAVDNITSHIATLQQNGIDPTAYFNKVYGKDYLTSLGIDLSGISGSVSTPSPTIGTSYDLSSYDPSNKKYQSIVDGYAQAAGSITSAQDAQNYINSNVMGSRKSSITGDMVMNAALQYDVDPAHILGIIQAENHFLTDPNAVTDTKNNNPGSIGGISANKKYSSLQEGVNAIAQWLSNHENTQKTKSSDVSLQQIQQKVPGITPADYSLATQVVDGLLAPSELSKRAATYSKTLAAAQEYSRAKYGKDFNVAQANRQYNFANQKSTQDTLNYLLSLTGDSGAPGNLDELKSQSNQITRTDFPALNNTAAWTKLQTGDPAIASYYATVTEVADQVAKILQGGGTGSGTSDSKLAQAQSLFQAGFSKNQLNAVIDALNPLLKNRATSIVKDNPYLSDYASRLNITGGSSDQTQSVSAGSVINYQGKNYTVDASGNLTPVQ